MRAALVAAALAAAVAAGAQTPAVSGARDAAAELLLRGEDARDAAMVRRAMREGADRRLGIRALGRLEQPALVAEVAPALDEEAGVRAEAANALAQMARTPDAVVEVQRLLTERAGVDAELGAWTAWGAMAAALGRLPFATAEQAASAERVLAGGLARPPASSPDDAARVIGAVRGLEALARTRRASKFGGFESGTWDLLRKTIVSGGATGRAAPIEARRLAMAALLTGGEASSPVIDGALGDADVEVRRLAALATGQEGPIEGRAGLLRRAIGDAAAQVRHEGLRAYARHQQAESCAPIVAAVADLDPHVRLLAVDLLGNGCPAAPGAGRAALADLVAGLTTRPRAWHAPAHAMVALAKTSPADALKALPRYAAHPIWQVRMYAARASGALGDIDRLLALARDPVDNVREAALDALVAARRPEATAVAIDGLASSDHQLVLTAARALTDAAAAPRAVPALVAALARLTSERKDTSRDPRLAILDRLEALGAAAQAAVVESYLTDFDPRVAARAADLVERWTGTPRTAAPRPLAAPGVSLAAVNAIRGRVLRVQMTGRGAFDIALDVDAAPLSALRVARLASEGYYDGLTFHRVAPNFVIQGGSPGANEFAGDALYMRDEPGRHVRGTVGISTRGRDTGDAQIFVNLVDSPRLDHAYTVFGVVSAGMEVVDGVIEGDLIERVELVGR